MKGIDDDDDDDDDDDLSSMIPQTLHNVSYAGPSPGSVIPEARIHRKACVVRDSCGFLQTCPSHFHLLS
ncbi:hypothetical protein ElyMa_003959800, partial [Elysia marginata]